MAIWITTAIKRDGIEPIIPDAYGFLAAAGEECDCCGWKFKAILFPKEILDEFTALGFEPYVQYADGWPQRDIRKHPFYTFDGSSDMIVVVRRLKTEHILPQSCNLGYTAFNDHGQWMVSADGEAESRFGYPLSLGNAAEPPAFFAGFLDELQAEFGLGVLFYGHWACKNDAALQAMLRARMRLIMMLVLAPKGRRARPRATFPRQVDLEKCVGGTEKHRWSTATRPSRQFLRALAQKGDDDLLTKTVALANTCGESLRKAILDSLAERVSEDQVAAARASLDTHPDLEIFPAQSLILPMLKAKVDAAERAFKALPPELLTVPTPEMYELDGAKRAVGICTDLLEREGSLLEELRNSTVFGPVNRDLLVNIIKPPEDEVVWPTTSGGERPLIDPLQDSLSRPVRTGVASVVPVRAGPPRPVRPSDWRASLERALSATAENCRVKATTAELVMRGAGDCAVDADRLTEVHNQAGRLWQFPDMRWADFLVGLLKTVAAGGDPAKVQTATAGEMNAACDVVRKALAPLSA